MLVMVRVSLTLFGTEAAGLETRFDNASSELRHKLRLPAEHASRRDADVAAVLTQRDATEQRRDVRFTEVCVGASSAALRTIEARIDACDQHAGFDLNLPRVRLEYLLGVGHGGLLPHIAPWRYVSESGGYASAGSSSPGTGGGPRWAWTNAAGALRFHLAPNTAVGRLPLPAWAVVTLVLGTSAIVAIAALVAGQLQVRHAHDERTLSEARQLREQGAAVVAPVLSLLTDADPQRLTATPGTQTMTLMNELLERWDALRDPIAVFAAGHPSRRIGEAADKLIVAVTNALTAAHWLIHDLPESWSKESLETARADNAEALRLARELLDAIRQTRAD
jgi:hypothetical protein